eukprot:jgi/Mesen1/4034/ME000212S03050
MLLTIEPDSEQRQQQQQQQQSAAANGVGKGVGAGAGAYQKLQMPVHQLARRAIDRLQLSPPRSLAWICDAAVQELRVLTGYERVFIARLHTRDYAQVIAEACDFAGDGSEEGAAAGYRPSWKGQHIPVPDDIDQEWLKGGAQQVVPMRFVMDTHAPQVPVLQLQPPLTPNTSAISGTAHPLLALHSSSLAGKKGGDGDGDGGEREHVVLKRTKPRVVEATEMRDVELYMNRRLQLAASASSKEAPARWGPAQQPLLWGLLFFHSYSQPWAVTGTRRAACTFIVQALKAHLLTALKADERVEERRMAALQTDICDRLNYQVPSALVTEPPSIRDLVPCDGVAHVRGDAVVTAGSCPSDAQIERLVKWVQEGQGEEGDSAEVYHTSSCLEEEGLAEAREWSMCSAVMAPLSGQQGGDNLLWFRNRASEALEWAWTDADAACMSHSARPPAAAATAEMMTATTQATKQKKKLLPSHASLWTQSQLEGVRGLQRLAQDALRGNSEPLKAMMLVRLNEERLKAMQDLAIVARDLGRMMEISKTPIFAVSRDLLLASVVGRELAHVLHPSSLGVALQSLAHVLQGHAQHHTELSLLCVPKKSKKSQAAIKPKQQQLPQDMVGAEEGEREQKQEQEQEEEEREVVAVLMTTMTPQLDSENRVVGVSIIGQDITEQKRTMAQCEDERASPVVFQQALDGASMPIWAVDKDGVVAEWNAAMSKTTGISKRDAVGKRLVGELMGAEKVLMVPERETLLSLEFAIQRALAGHETPSVPSFKFVNNEGRRFDTVINLHRRKEGDVGGKGEVLCFMQDMTMRRAMEEAMVVRLAAEAAADAKSRHLAFLCHEIRNPLNGILGNITFMEDTRLSEEQKELVETTATCGYQLRKIVQDVLDISQIEEGRVQLDCQELHLQRIVNAVISQVGIAAAKKGLQLYSTIEPRCKAWHPAGDASRLQQVLSNFAWNSVKFTQQGWVEISIGMQEPQLQGDGDGDGEGKQTARYSFRVADSGEGISESLRKRLFEQFATGRKTSSSQYGGTGLGLSICQQLAAVMGGDIRCQSEVGKGSIFSLEVDLEVSPRKDARPAPSAPPPPPAVAAAAAGELEGGAAAAASEPSFSSDDEVSAGRKLHLANGEIVDAAATAAQERPALPQEEMVSEKKGGGQPKVTMPRRKQAAAAAAVVVEGLPKAHSARPPASAVVVPQPHSSKIRHHHARSRSLSALPGQQQQQPAPGSQVMSTRKQPSPAPAPVPAAYDSTTSGTHSGPPPASAATAVGIRGHPPSSYPYPQAHSHPGAGPAAAYGLVAMSPTPTPHPPPPSAAPAPLPPAVAAAGGGRQGGRPIPFALHRAAHMRRAALPKTAAHGRGAGGGGSQQMSRSSSATSLVSAAPPHAEPHHHHHHHHSQQPPPPEADLAARLTSIYGSSWSFRVVREMMTPQAVAVLVEVTAGSSIRQQWGSVACDNKKTSPELQLAAATSAALHHAAALFPPSSGISLPLPPFSGGADHMPAPPTSTTMMGAPPSLPLASPPPPPPAPMHPRFATAYSPLPQPQPLPQPLRQSQSVSTSASLPYGASLYAAAGGGGLSGAASWHIAGTGLDAWPLQQQQQEGPDGGVPPPAGLGGLRDYRDLSAATPIMAAADSIAGGVRRSSTRGVGGEAQYADPFFLQQPQAQLQAWNPLLAAMGSAYASSSSSDALKAVQAQAPISPNSRGGGGSPPLPLPPMSSAHSPRPARGTGSLLSQQVAIMVDAGDKAAAQGSFPRSPSLGQYSSSDGELSMRSPILSPGTSNGLASPPNDRGGPKVLIIDDEPVNVRVVKRALDRADFDVRSGSDGVDVVERVIENGEQFDALLLDERLKVMNGSEACLKVREFEAVNGVAEMPIIAISANVEPDDLPINVRTVGERLREFLLSYKPLPTSRRAELRKGQPVKILKHLEDMILFS